MHAINFLTAVARSVHYTLFEGADTLRQVRSLSLRTAAAPEGWQHAGGGGRRCAVRSARSLCPLC